MKPWRQVEGLTEKEKAAFLAIEQQEAGSQIAVEIQANGDLECRLKTPRVPGKMLPFTLKKPIIQ